MKLQTIQATTPRNDESAGKWRSDCLRHGAAWLKTTLVLCAWAATRTKASTLQAQFQRLRHRRGPKKAICAVAASILTAAYPMLRDGTFYQNPGQDPFRRRVLRPRDRNRHVRPQPSCRHTPPGSEPDLLTFESEQKALGIRGEHATVTLG